VLFAPGFHVVTAPLAASSAAMFARASVPMLSNEPAT
jgi:hypothetical protein